MTHARNKLSVFADNKDGSGAMLFAILAGPAIGIIGLGIDTGRALSASSRLQVAVEAAVVAGAKDPTNAIEAANVTFDVKRTTIGNYALTSSFAFNESGDLVGNASADIPTTIMQVTHVDKLSINASAVAKAGSTTTRVTETIERQIVVPGQPH
ncbi:MAG: TadE/TadG family type IV pilus assembly protein [Hyphomicrobiaceae bacterium]